MITPGPSSLDWYLTAVRSVSKECAHINLYGIFSNFEIPFTVRCDDLLRTSQKDYELNLRYAEPTAIEKSPVRKLANYNKWNLFKYPWWICFLLPRTRDLAEILIADNYILITHVEHQKRADSS